ncbi:hypothetical protein [Pseudomonas sp. DP-17]|uniref:hypothetical protein n=1 Tax=Pseudomonas sp. DP-17 TaxID=1580486 RepID=UPI001EFB0CE1|nr:hypothetical protein [Pseudomonas sp. DP-17]MCG8911030.1 hypothetical protein [Pseudomonas sp. DP-17]
MLEKRQYQPINGQHPVEFIVSVASLQVELKSPWLRMRSLLGRVTFTDDTFSLQQIPVVNVFGGTENQWWEIKLRPEDAADLKALVEYAKTVAQA